MDSLVAPARSDFSKAAGGNRKLEAVDVSMQQFLVYEAKGRQIAKFWRDFTLPMIPRKGDYLTLNGSDGVSQAYEVVGLLVPVDGESATIELIIRPMGTEQDFRKQLGFP